MGTPPNSYSISSFHEPEKQYSKAIFSLKVVVCFVRGLDPCPRKFLLARMIFLKILLKEKV